MNSNLSKFFSLAFGIILLLMVVRIVMRFDLSPLKVAILGVLVLAFVYRDRMDFTTFVGLAIAAGFVLGILSYEALWALLGDIGCAILNAPITLAQAGWGLLLIIGVLLFLVFLGKFISQVKAITEGVLGPLWAAFHLFFVWVLPAMMVGALIGLLCSWL